MKLNSHHPLPKLKISGGVSPLLHTPSWRGRESFTSFLTKREQEKLLDEALEDGAVTELVEALRCYLESSGFDSRWCHWNFSLT
jgi:hypothetical protein